MHVLGWNEWINGSMNAECMFYDDMNKWKNGKMNTCFMIKWMNEWMNEWIIEWMEKFIHF